jgi:hypothetical protein
MSFAAKSLKPVVAIPVRNEAQRLPALLDGLAHQTWLKSSSAALEVVLILNNCTDASADVALTAKARFQTLSLDITDIDLPSDIAHVGSARRLAMDRALEIGGPRSVLLATDADAVPTPNWIDANLRAIEAGADIVGGHIVGDKSEEAMLGPGFVRRAARHLYYQKLIDRLAALIAPLPHDPWPRHADHTGASLAVRGEVYAAIGGMPQLAYREDIAFVTKACQAGYRLKHPLDVNVVVSARLDGRASGGMADCLKSWVAAEANSLPILVEAPSMIASRLARRRDAGLSHLAFIDTSPDAVRAPTDIETAIKLIECMITDVGTNVRVA